MSRNGDGFQIAQNLFWRFLQFFISKHTIEVLRVRRKVAELGGDDMNKILFSTVIAALVCGNVNAETSAKIDLNRKHSVGGEVSFNRSNTLTRIRTRLSLIGLARRNCSMFC